MTNNKKSRGSHDGHDAKVHIMGILLHVLCCMMKNKILVTDQQSSSRNFAAAAGWCITSMHKAKLISLNE